jgi:hypothetical protein
MTVPAVMSMSVKCLFTNEHEINRFQHLSSLGHDGLLVADGILLPPAVFIFLRSRMLVEIGKHGLDEHVVLRGCFPA